MVGTDDGFARLMTLQYNHIYCSAVHLFAQLGIADLLAAGPRAATDLAEAVDVRPEPLRRVLRTLTGCGVVTQVAPGRFGLTALGAHLRSDHPQSIRAFMATSTLFATAFADGGHTLRTGEPSFPHTFGVPLFAYLRDNPDLAAMFTRAMADTSRHEIPAILDGYDFTGARQIVDVGGGDTTMLDAILSVHPATKGILFDLPHVADAASGSSERCAVVGGDFFESVPAGADLYLLKSVVHNWPDDKAVTILRTCRRAMPPDGRLLLIERVVPAGDEPHPSKVMDFAMLVVLGGQERTRDEFAVLLAQAGLRLTDSYETRSALSVLEAVPDGENQERTA